MGSIAANLKQNVVEAQRKRTQLPDCGYEGLGAGKMVFVDVKGHAIGGAQYDVAVKIPIACRRFAIVSDAAPTNSKFLSVDPTGKTNPSGSAAVAFDGLENWFPLNTVQNASTIYWLVLTLPFNVDLIYLSMGTESGATNQFRLICCVDDSLDLRGGMYT